MRRCTASMVAAAPKGETNLTLTIARWVLPLALVGCGTPAVILEAPPRVAEGSPALPATAKAAAAGAVPVTLPVSRIVVSPAKQGANAQYEVAVVPVPGPHRFNVRPVNDLWSQNVLAVEYVQGTSVPKTVSNKFTDLTAKRVEQAGGIIASFVGVAKLGIASAGSGTSRGCDGQALPMVYLDVTGPLDGVGKGGEVPGTAGCFSWHLAPVEATPNVAGTLPVAEFASHAAATDGAASRFWPVSVCREVNLTIMRAGQAEATLQVRTTVADPDRLQLFPLPQNGKLAMHPVCGADLTDSPGDRFQAFTDALTALGKQAEAVGKKLKAE